MKISNVIVDSVLRISHVDVGIQKPCVMFAGVNESGKSSLYHSIRMALTGDILRADLKREYKSLVHDGAKEGRITVTTGGVLCTLALPSGDQEGVATDHPATLRAVLDSHRLINMEEADRRKFLFGLTGVQVNVKAILERLKQKGCDVALSAELESILAAGFDTANKRAASNASEARGAWKSLAGETYGDKKAAVWKAVTEALTEAEATEATRLENSLVQIERDLADAQQRFGAARSQQHAVETYGETLDAARLRANGVNAAQYLEKAQTDVDEWQAKVTQLAQAQERYPCPDCGSMLSLVGNKLENAGDTTPDPAALKQAQQSLASCLKVRDRHKAAVDDAAKASAEVKTLIDNKPKPPEHSPGTIQETINTLTADMRKARERLTVLNAKNDAALRADADTKKAAGYHAQVQAWSKIADALAPDGIPGEILADALKPMNNRLRLTAIATDWPQVTIDSSMQITADNRPWRLLSGSAQWKVGAMISEAISFISGLKMVLLDEVDILLPQGRVELIIWLDKLAREGDIECAMLFMASKTRPKGLPESFAVHWMEGGTIVPEQAA